ncbi:TATA box-binding protein-associated factor RNA polymerase I subunit B-like [Aedes albopictus]|uniref:Rrn7/TAF1B C-terminal cyclin domain-containing protein n=1 Tax=Aedes albopictus TaxID=7160 RepID=A0ABM1YBE1_AEDAL
MDTCEVCGQHEFTVDEGFHYCVECGTKSQQHGIEMVAEFDEHLPMGGANAVGGGTIRIKPTKKKKGKMLTSWEVVNFILLGYTDRLVTIGAGENFKLTVLQLWTAYLRRSEVAFFDKTKPERPRLDVFHRKTDANIIYNRKLKKKRERRKSTVSSVQPSSAPTSGVALTKKVRSEQRSLLNAEYDTFRASQSDINRSLHELSVRSLNASLSGTESETSSKSGGQKIKYSRLARIKMKRRLKMSTKHIDKHESDVEDVMKCHASLEPNKRLNSTRRSDPECLYRKAIASILALALNVSRSPVQFADLLRLYREEHISCTNLMQYIPEEVDTSSCVETLCGLQRGRSLAHTDLLMGVRQMMKFLNVKPVVPDFSKLCKRYLEELCLPDDLMVLLDRLLAVFPPKMEHVEGRTLSNYEARAMAFIMFMLKLLFGCNDSTEMKLSKSATKFNTMHKNLGPSYRQLFVFLEWLRYLEMRKVILAQVHYPTNRMVAKEEGSEQNPDLFIDYNLRKKQGGDLFGVSSKPVNRNWMSKLKDFSTNVVDTLHRLNPTTKSPQSIEFEPSLTPNRSYLETFLLAYNRDEKIHVPKFMHENHGERSVVPLVSPSDLKQLLQTNHRITLKTKKVPSAISQLEFIDSTVVNNTLWRVMQNESPYLLIDECDESDWTPPPKRTSITHSHEHILSRILIRNMEQSQETQLDHTLPSDDTDQTATESILTSSSNHDFFGSPQPSSSQESLIPPYQNTTHSLLTPNYDYWVRFYPVRTLASREQFDEEVAVTLPDNFRLVLEECARIVETHPMVLYQELMTVEAYLFYAVQPVERFFDGTAGCPVQFARLTDSHHINSLVSEAKRKY